MSTKIILILFIISNTFFGAFYFSDIAKEYGTNENKNTEEKTIIETNEQLKTDYNINTNSIESFFSMEGTNIIKQNGVVSSPVILEDSYKSNPFRYTEVTFILTAFFSYTYATYLTLGLQSIENANVVTTTGRNRYKSLWISSMLFEITAGIFCGAAVAYDSYQRVYGKKKNDGFSFSFVPFYEPINQDAGFVFSLNHPL
ncbi:hypothetical protein JQ824_01610 [Brachyspira hyodysenteriae]|uniref:Uncharacterized protein n=2 Tax=Brachyspira hyodysenteriae TaxID=159 RepID=A0A3B6V9B4_BRAHW|nr:hypothetical protein [Brachyspira hyodysenteriae]ACN83399.1 hypothetical protein BHWA1_00908 [Brachyspira hyodysenteriae WA1]ANN64460.1 hypothetical protein BHYOB78_11465 [Brachyspira hyodysenteriae ATCC 27164]AUJ49137.1 hypothetical protein BH718_00682 [Brachyspira hyodysenteriae]KLI14672.1 hypothetical protein SU44_09895 [Brachyspira hyodysenteriae]KLI18214.1 hypothetical protein SU45_02655 [Brachyspira hyodysenteriae]